LTKDDYCLLAAMQGLLEIAHELMERLEAHLTAEQFYSVIANMRGESAEEVSARLLQNPLLRGFQVRSAALSSCRPAEHAAARPPGGPCPTAVRAVPLWLRSFMNI
jgi:hypothetical protein